MILKINMAHQYKFMCPLYNHVEAFHVIIMNECCIFHLQLLHIINLPLLNVLTPFRSSCTPSTNCAHSFVDYDHTSADYTNFSTNCVNKFDDYVKTLDE